MIFSHDFARESIKIPGIQQVNFVDIGISTNICADTWKCYAHDNIIYVFRNTWSRKWRK